MTIIDDYIEQSIPHESGHILAGRFVGIPVFRLDHEIILTGTNEISTGNFITVGMSPPPVEPLIVRAMTPPDVLKAYTLFIAGGLAGNKVTGTAATEHGLAKDRVDLSRVSDRTLEEVAESSTLIIQKNMGAFEKLQAAFRKSYQDLTNNGQPTVGRHTLLTPDQLEAICPQSKRLQWFFSNQP